MLLHIAESPPYLRSNNVLHFLCLSFGGHLGYIHVFSLMNNTAMNMAVLISLSSLFQFFKANTQK